MQSLKPSILLKYSYRLRLGIVETKGLIFSFLISPFQDVLTNSNHGFKYRYPTPYEMGEWRTDSYHHHSRCALAVSTWFHFQWKKTLAWISSYQSISIHICDVYLNTGVNEVSCQYFKLVSWKLICTGRYLKLWSNAIDPLSHVTLNSSYMFNFRLIWND